MAGFFIWGHWAAFYSLLPDIVPYEILGTTYGLTNTIHFTGSLIAPWATSCLALAMRAVVAALVGDPAKVARELAEA
jgi:hypothetical protein